jgi:hypothetical protein
MTNTPWPSTIILPFPICTHPSTETLPRSQTSSSIRTSLPYAGPFKTCRAIPEKYHLYANLLLKCYVGAFHSISGTKGCSPRFMVLATFPRTKLSIPSAVIAMISTLALLILSLYKQTHSPSIRAWSVFICWGPSYLKWRKSGTCGCYNLQHDACYLYRR